MHTRSDRCPLVAIMDGEPPELMDFERNERRQTRWTPTPASATRVARYWAENISGNENQKHIRNHLEKVAKKEFDIAKREQEELCTYRPETPPP